MAGLAGIKFGKGMTITKFKGEVTVIDNDNDIIIDELESYLEREMSALFKSKKIVETKEEIKRTKNIEEKIGTKGDLIVRLCDLAIKEENEGLTKEEKHYAAILAKLYLIMD